MRSRPLLSFFVAVFLITWSVAAAAVFASDWFGRVFGPLSASNPMFFLGVYAPSLVSIALTAAFEDGPACSSCSRGSIPGAAIRSGIWW